MDYVFKGVIAFFMFLILIRNIKYFKKWKSLGNLKFLSVKKKYLQIILSVFYIIYFLVLLTTNIPRNEWLNIVIWLIIPLAAIDMLLKIVIKNGLYDDGFQVMNGSLKWASVSKYDFINDKKETVEIQFFAKTKIWFFSFTNYYVIRISKSNQKAVKRFLESNITD